MASKRILTLMAIPAAFLVSGLAFGQMPPAAPTTAPPPPAPQYQSMSTDTTPSPTFDDLAGTKGYVSKSDTAQVSWMSGHFAQCDANQDQKLSRDEYQACARAYGQSGGGQR